MFTRHWITLPEPILDVEPYQEDCGVITMGGVYEIPGARPPFRIDGCRLWAARIPWFARPFLVRAQAFGVTHRRSEVRVY